MHQSTDGDLSAYDMQIAWDWIFNLLVELSDGDHGFISQGGMLDSSQCRLMVDKEGGDHVRIEHHISQWEHRALDETILVQGGLVDVIKLICSTAHRAAPFCRQVRPITPILHYRILISNIYTFGCPNLSHAARISPTTNILPAAIITSPGLALVIARSSAVETGNATSTRKP